jgi:hypothetical protein
MTSKRHKVKNRKPDTYPSCLLCGKGDLGPYTLQVVQAGGEEPVWTHGHSCVAILLIVTEDVSAAACIADCANISLRAGIANSNNKIANGTACFCRCG